MSFSSLSPEFRDSLRKMADELYSKQAEASKPEPKPIIESVESVEPVKPVIRVASELEQIEEVIDEGSDADADNK